MSDLFLVVSHPPHHEAFDIPACVEVFGLAAPEIRAKTNFAAPDIWFAESDLGQAQAKAAKLTAAGVNAVAVPGAHITALPAQCPIRQFTFGSDGLVCHTDQGHTTLPYAASVLAVNCRPQTPEAPRQKESSIRRGAKKGFRRAAMIAQGGMVWGNLAADYLNSIDKMNTGGARLASGRLPGFVDFWFADPSGPRRLTIVEGITEFGGLGEKKAFNHQQNVVALLQELIPLFATLQVDSRLENLPYRSMPPPVSGYSWQKLTELLYPGARSVYPFELQSRLGVLALAGGQLPAAPAPPPPQAAPATPAVPAPPAMEQAPPTTQLPAPYVPSATPPKPKSDPFAF